MIVASNAFKFRIDQPDVQVVIHVKPIHQMQDYRQQSGRGRGDRQRSEAIILFEAGKQEALQSQFIQRPIRRVIGPVGKA
jgi:ATP-dependent DNA helicase RecQ